MPLFAFQGHHVLSSRKKDIPLKHTDSANQGLVENAMTAITCYLLCIILGIYLFIYLILFFFIICLVIINKTAHIYNH